MAHAYPRAADLDIQLNHVLGAQSLLLVAASLSGWADSAVLIFVGDGLDSLSMSQLNGLEELFQTLLRSVGDSKVAILPATFLIG